MNVQFGPDDTNDPGFADPGTGVRFELGPEIVGQ
jgi:hypothetical protein